MQKERPSSTWPVGTVLSRSAKGTKEGITGVNIYPGTPRTFIDLNRSSLVNFIGVELGSETYVLVNRRRAQQVEA